MDQNSNSEQQEGWFLGNFNPRSMIFLRWINSFEYKLEMANIKKGEKVKYLLNMLNPCVIKKIEEIVFPSDPYDLSYNDLIILLENTCSHFQGREAANLRFTYRNQLPDESVDHYVHALRKLLSKCTPSIKNMANLRHKFIRGLADQEIKTLLIKHDNISFPMVVFIAKQRELAKNQK